MVPLKGTPYIPYHVTTFRLPETLIPEGSVYIVYSFGFGVQGLGFRVYTWALEGFRYN